MSTEIILKAENVSKQYRLGQVGMGTISHDLSRWWHRIRGKEDPFLKIGDANDRTIVGESDYVWALKDIDFEVKRGEVIGIIGKNGAGKSTLLKILSKVTAPTTGTIKFNGRIASLLEVGTGFHPELTGRENIYLNGAILGMTKKEISSKIHEIIEFSGCQRYIDTPVKRYSSGMTVRLAFAVAAFLEPEILIVDEVLAVGDADFQKKALGKMQDVSKMGGKTVLFVSHNLASVKSLCTKGIVMEHGKIKFEGEIDDALAVYLEINSKEDDISVLKFEEDSSKAAQVLEVRLIDKDGNKVTEYFNNQDIFIEIMLRNDYIQKNARLNFSILDKFENVIFINRRELDFIGLKTWTIKINSDNLIANSYLIGLALDIPSVKLIDLPIRKITLNIINIAQEEFKDGDVENGIFKLPVRWME